MKDGVYIVRRGKTYRVTRNCKCTARSCSLYDAAKCESFDGEHPCLAILRLANKCGACIDFANFREVRT